MRQTTSNDVNDSRCLEEEGYEGNRLNGRKVSFARGWNLGLEDDAHSGLHFEEHGLTWCSTGRTLAYLLGNLPDDQKQMVLDRALERFAQLNLKKEGDQ